MSSSVGTPPLIKPPPTFPPKAESGPKLSTRLGMPQQVLQSYTGPIMDKLPTRLELNPNHTQLAKAIRLVKVIQLAKGIRLAKLM